MSTESLSGIVERITFYSQENGWSVLKVKVFGQSGQLETVVLNQNIIHAGATVEFSGFWSEHPKFGKQFKADSYIEKRPASAAALEKYLGSGLIKGVGPKTAKRIVRYFGEKTLEIFEKKIEALLEVPGIARKKLQAIQKSWEEHKQIRDVMIFLQGHGISTLFAIKIYKQYGNDSIRVLRENPYRLAKDIYGIGFHSADQVALQLGIDPESEVRSLAAIRHLLAAAQNEGHCYLSLEQISANGEELLKYPWQKYLSEQLLKLENLKEIKVQLHPLTQMPCYFHNKLFFDEKNISQRVKSFHLPQSLDQKRAEQWIQKYEHKIEIKLSDEQRLAVLHMADLGISILTGGPGCGKTTTTKTLVALMEAMKKSVVLAAPTGRAAQRMSEVIGRESKTIHRLLEWDPKSMGFKKNQDNPLSGDVFIFDECSMLDTGLAASLFAALPDQCQVFLVGDPDQLPSVGPGQVMQDLIASNSIAVFKLTQIHRQDDRGKLVAAAHQINAGKLPWIDGPLENKELWEGEQDLFFIDSEEVTVEQAKFLRTAKQFLSRRFDEGSSFSIQREQTTQAYFEKTGLIKEAAETNHLKEYQLQIPEKFFHADLNQIFSSESESDQLLGLFKKIPPFSSLHYGLTTSQMILRLYQDQIPKRFPHAEIQILSPMTKGSLGTHRFNFEIQKQRQLIQSTRKVSLGERVFHIGDRVIQKRNNYDLEVFNGDIGEVVDLSAQDQELIVSFGMNSTQRTVCYTREDFIELDLAYAVTIHKSQGSEFDIVIIPLAFQHFKMLHRNLIYTGMTRGKRRVILVGQRKALYLACQQEETSKRQTFLRWHMVN